MKTDLDVSPKREGAQPGFVPPSRPMGMQTLAGSDPRRAEEGPVPRAETILSFMGPSSSFMISTVTFRFVQ
jgi:hypothetical protein